MVTAQKIIETLGGARTLRRPWRLQDLSKQARAGLPYAALEALVDRLELTPQEINRVLGIPARTLARRKVEQRLRGSESDRLLRVARIAAVAEDVLGSREKAARWLRSPNRALGQRHPFAELDTDLGAREVEDVLVRLAHGVAS